MKRQALYFTGERRVEVREEALSVVSSSQSQFSSLASLVSAGSEMLFYRNELSAELPLDEVLPGLDGNFQYPLKFGYSIVGCLENDADQRYFALNPHESAFYAKTKGYLKVPQDCPTEDAIFLANMETSINIVLDANPRLGEKVVVIGLGVLGLLTSSVLRAHPLDMLAALDPLEIRRKAAGSNGVDRLCDPIDADEIAKLKEALGKQGADTVIELSGEPQSLNLAMQLVGPQGKIVVGSWYGERQAQIKLGSQFHQGRTQVISSHVGQIPPGLRGRWNRKRRFRLAWDWLRRIQPSKWITHRFAFQEAALAYELIDQHPEQCIALALEYEAKQPE